MTGPPTSPDPETRELTARLERAVTALEEFLAAESRPFPMLTVVGQPEVPQPEPALAEVIEFPRRGSASRPRAADRTVRTLRRRQRRPVRAPARPGDHVTRATGCGPGTWARAPQQEWP